MSDPISPDHYKGAGGKRATRKRHRVTEMRSVQVKEKPILFSKPMVLALLMKKVNGSRFRKPVVS